MTCSTSSHHELGPSSLARAFTCPASVALSRQYEKYTSSHAEAGTRAHALIEQSYKQGYPEPTGDDELDANVTFCLDALKRLQATYGTSVTLLEQRLEIPHIGSFGTCDCYMFSDDTLVVADFKLGHSVVYEPEKNPQLLAYTLGALQQLKIHGVEPRKIVVVIIQPNVPHTKGPVREWHVSQEDLADFVLRIKELVYTLNTGPFFQVSKECQFCPALSGCSCFHDTVIKPITAEDGSVKEPRNLSDEELIERFAFHELLGSYRRALEQEAVNRALKGLKFPGYKLNNKTPREHLDADAETLVDLLGIPREIAVKEVVRTPKQIRKDLEKSGQGEKANRIEKLIRRTFSTSLVRDTSVGDYVVNDFD